MSTKWFIDNCKFTSVVSPTDSRLRIITILMPCVGEHESASPDDPKLNFTLSDSEAYQAVIHMSYFYVIMTMTELGFANAVDLIRVGYQRIRNILQLGAVPCTTHEVFRS